MEYGNTPIAERQSRRAPNAELDGGGEQLVRQRLETLLAMNAERALEKSMFATEREKLDCALMTNPLSIEKAFAHLGLLLGTFPPAAFFARFFIDARIAQGKDLWILGVVAVVVLISAAVGFLSGKLVGRTVSKLEKASWSKMLLALPFVGILWGAAAGGAGGVIVFVVGAFFGAALGGLVGAAALPIFAVFHRWLKRGDKIETKHFLPLAFGIAFVVAAFILGL